MVGCPSAENPRPPDYLNQCLVHPQPGVVQAGCQLLTRLLDPVLNMSLRISSSDSFAANGGLRGDCLIGRASPVDILLDDITKP